MAELDYDDFDIFLDEDDEYVSNRNRHPKTLKDKLNIVISSAERKIEKIVNSVEYFEEEPDYSLVSKHDKKPRCYIDEWGDYSSTLECDGNHYEERSVFEGTKYDRRYPDDFEVVYDYYSGALEPDEDYGSSSPKRNFLDKILGR